MIHVTDLLFFNSSGGGNFCYAVALLTRALVVSSQDLNQRRKQCSSSHSKLYKSCLVSQSKMVSCHMAMFYALHRVENETCHW